MDNLSSNDYDLSMKKVFNGLNRIANEIFSGIGSEQVRMQDGTTFNFEVDDIQEMFGQFQSKSVRRFEYSYCVPMRNINNRYETRTFVLKLTADANKPIKQHMSTDYEIKVETIPYMRIGWFTRLNSTGRPIGKTSFHYTGDKEALYKKMHTAIINSICSQYDRIKGYEDILRQTNHG